MNIYAQKEKKNIQENNSNNNKDSNFTSKNAPKMLNSACFEPNQKCPARKKSVFRKQ